MTIPNKQEIIEKIFSMITPEMEKEYFILCEIIVPNRPVFHTGGIKRNDNGYGSDALLMKYSEEPATKYNATDEQFENAHKSFENVKNYYENIIGEFRAFHLKEGIKVAIENNLDPPYYMDEDFIQVWSDWWENEYQPYIARFMTKEDWEKRAKNLSLLADALDSAIKNQTDEAESRR